MNLQKVVKDIKTLKIQGATNIALAGSKALNLVAQNSQQKTKKDFLKEINNAQFLLVNARVTEPKIKNSLKYILLKLRSRTVPELKEQIKQKSEYVLKHLTESKDYIGHIGSLKIKNNMIIFTHCHSSTVIKILKYAKTKHRRFYVHNTESRPLYQGRITAKEQAKAKIPIQLYVDSAAIEALKNADIMLIGADAITANGDIVNKIGSRLFAETAERYNVKIYACTDSWSYDPETKHHKEKIEQRDPSEVWKHPPKHVKIINPAFEVIPAKLVDGIISELGFYKPEHFLHKVKRNYPWLR